MHHHYDGVHYSPLEMLLRWVYWRVRRMPMPFLGDVIGCIERARIATAKIGLALTQNPGSSCDLREPAMKEPLPIPPMCPSTQSWCFCASLGCFSPVSSIVPVKKHYFYKWTITHFHIGFQFLPCLRPF